MRNVRGQNGLNRAINRYIRNHLRNRKPKRLHMTNRLFKKFVNHEQRPEYKPTGMWYGVHDSWIQWCNSEMSGWIGRYLYEVVTHEDQILKIDTIEKFEAFEQEYLYNPYKDQMAKLAGLIPALDTQDYLPLRMKSVDYVSLSKNYAGLEIAPYFYEKRLSSFWYYGWDCASGCIWNKSAIKQIRLLGQYNKQIGDFVKIKKEVKC